MSVGTSRITAVLGAYFELARLSNAPTVITNVLVGVAIGLHGTDAVPNWGMILMLCIAILLLYVGGMVMNDMVDHRIDERERPSRPLPSGRASRQSAAIMMVTSFLIGLILLGWMGGPVVVGIALVVAIVAYNMLHKKHAWSVVLMGLCRGLVYLAGAVAVSWPIDGTVFAPLFIAIVLYIVLITLIARGEAQNRLPISQRLAMLMLLVAAIPALFVFPNNFMPMILAGVILIGWLVITQRHLLGSPPRMKQAVMAWLAGICLLDAFFLTLLDRAEWAPIALVCFGVTVLAHRFVSGT